MPKPNVDEARLQEKEAYRLFPPFMTCEELLEQVMKILEENETGQEEATETEEDADDTETIPPPSNTAVLGAMELLQRYAAMRGDDDVIKGAF